MIKQVAETSGLPLTATYNATRGFYIQLNLNGQEHLAENLPPNLIKVVKTKKMLSCTTEDIVSNCFVCYLYMKLLVMNFIIMLSLFYGLVLLLLNIIIIHITCDNLIMYQLNNSVKKRLRIKCNVISSYLVYNEYISCIYILNYVIILRDECTKMFYNINISCFF